MEEVVIIMILEEKSDKVEKFVCMHNGVDDDSVVVARCTLFVKGKRLLEMISPISDALEIHFARAIYQAQIWINADASIMITQNAVGTRACQCGSEGLNVFR